MSNEPKVSVIIPTYNQCSFLAEALSSLIKQSFTDWEAIVIDNLSVDKTKQVVHSFNDQRIKYVLFSNNGIIGASRNKGISLTKGMYLAFLDSDDLWETEKLEKSLKAFDDDVGVVCHALEYFGDESKKVYPGRYGSIDFDSLIMNGNCLTPSAVVVKRKYLNEVGGFSERPELVTSEDYHLWLRLTFMGVKVKSLDDVLTRYRVHKASASSKAIAHMESVLAVLNEFFTDDVNLLHYGKLQVRRRYGIVYYGTAMSLQYNNHYMKSFLYILKSLTTYPFSPRFYYAFFAPLFRNRKPYQLHGIIHK